MKVKSESEVTQLCPTLGDPMDCSPPGFSVHGIFQARVLSGVPLPSPDFWFAVAAAAKSLQSCPTLCDPMDGSPPGSSVHGIFQARVLEWGAIDFSGFSYEVLSNPEKRALYDGYGEQGLREGSGWWKWWHGYFLSHFWWRLIWLHGQSEQKSKWQKKRRGQDASAQSIFRRPV